MKGRPAGVVLVDPAVRRPRQEVRNEERHPRVRPDRVESRVGLDAMKLDEVACLHKRQDADLRVASSRAGGQRSVSHLRHEALRGFHVRWIVRARKHTTSLLERALSALIQNGESNGGKK